MKSIKYRNLEYGVRLSLAFSGCCEPRELHVYQVIEVVNAIEVIDGAEVWNCVQGLVPGDKLSVISRFSLVKNPLFLT